MLFCDSCAKCKNCVILGNPNFMQNTEKNCNILKDLIIYCCLPITAKSEICYCMEYLSIMDVLAVYDLVF